MYSISHKATPTQRAVATPKSWASGHSHRIPVAARVHLVKLNKHMQPSSSSRVTKIEIIKKNQKQTLALMKNKSSLSHCKTVFGDIGYNIMGGPKVIQWSAVFVSNIWWYFIIVYSRPVCVLTEWNKVQYNLHWPPVQGCLHHGSWERKDSGSVKNKSYQE